jgi:hypothetical protein
MKKAFKMLKTIETQISLKTEDTGKIFEMAICKTYGIPFVGKYKYGMEEPELIMNKLILLKKYYEGI